MPRRTTIILDDDVYESLVRESVRKYGTARAISKVVNELIRERLEASQELLGLIYSSKLAWTDQEDFEKERRELSARMEKT